MKESFIKRAVENIESAEILFDHGKFNAPANRAYYAAFHIAIAAVFSIGIIPIIDHRSVHSIFVDSFINKRKILPSKYKRYFNDLQNVRNLADYKEGVNKKKAKEQLYKSKEIIGLILKVIK